MKECVHTPRRNKTTNNSTGPHQTSNASSPERHQDTEQEQNVTEPASTRESEPDTMRADGGNLKPGAVGESQVGAEKKGEPEAWTWRNSRLITNRTKELSACRGP